MTDFRTLRDRCSAILVLERKDSVMLYQSRVQFDSKTEEPYVEMKLVIKS